MDLQELITRGRFIMSNAPARIKVFQLVNGRRTAKDIAGSTKRHVNSVNRDLRKLREMDIIRQVVNGLGEPIFADGLPVYEKVPVARNVALSYFKDRSKSPAPRPSNEQIKARGKTAAAEKLKPLRIPSVQDLLDICRYGEDQTHEFKGPRTSVWKISREIAAMLNTSQGGLIFYGVDDAGSILGTDIPRQRFDQSLQNSVRNTIVPAATVTLGSVAAIGHGILVVVAPPWNRQDVYQHDHVVFIRKGTNVFKATPAEIRKLHDGQYIV